MEPRDSRLRPGRTRVPPPSTTPHDCGQQSTPQPRRLATPTPKSKLIDDITSTARMMEHPETLQCLRAISTCVVEHVEEHDEGNIDYWRRQVEFVVTSRNGRRPSFGEWANQSKFAQCYREVADAAASYQASKTPSTSSPDRTTNGTRIHGAVR